MHRNVIFTFGLSVYFILAVFSFINFDMGLLTAAVFILGIPSYLLARFSAAPTVMLITIASFGIGMSFLLEGLGYMYGLWQHTSHNGFLVFGGLSLGVLMFTVLKILFLVLFYELLFDDGEYSIARARNRSLEFGFFAVGAVVMVSIFYVLMDNLSTPNAYYWITTILVLSSIGMLFLRQSLSLRLFNKISYFVAVAAIPMLCLEAFLVASGYKIFTSTIHIVPFPLVQGGLPLGELLLAFSIPAFVATIYELYLDDRV